MVRQIQVCYPGDKIVIFSTVSEAPTQEFLLEEIFAQFNAGSGQESKEFIDARVRSLSVNDFVVIDGIGYQCQSCGWKEVSENFIAKVIEMVEDHPMLKVHGAWFALSDAMRILRKWEDAKLAMAA